MSECAIKSCSTSLKISWLLGNCVMYQHAVIASSWEKNITLLHPIQHWHKRVSTNMELTLCHHWHCSDNLSCLLDHPYMIPCQKQYLVHVNLLYSCNTDYCSLHNFKKNNNRSKQALETIIILRKHKCLSDLSARLTRVAPLMHKYSSIKDFLHRFHCRMQV